MIYMECKTYLTPDQCRDLADYLCAMADDDERSGPIGIGGEGMAGTPGGIAL